MSKTRNKYSQKTWLVSFVVAFVAIGLIIFGFLYFQALVLQDTFKDITF